MSVGRKSCSFGVLTAPLLGAALICVFPLDWEVTKVRFRFISVDVGHGE